MDEGQVGGSLHEVRRLAGVLSDGAAALLAAPVWSLSVAEKVEALVEVERAGRAVEAARLGLVRCLEGEELLRVGATSVAGLLRSRCRVGPGRARADVEAARAVDPDVPAVGPGAVTSAGDVRGALVGMGAALLAGEVSRPHLDVAVRVLDKIPTRIRRAAAPVVDEFFVDVSTKHPPRECEVLAAELLDRLDPDRTERGFDPDAYARRRFEMVTDATGMLLVSGQLDPITGAQLKAAVEHYAAPDPASSDADGTLLTWDTRTASQRRADALAIVARQGLANAGSRGGEPPRVVVHTSVDQLAALQVGQRLAERTAAGRAWCEQVGFITPTVLERLGCSAVFERVLLAPDGAVVNLGRTVRLATSGQRRALAARDKGCIIPGCNRPAKQCDAHHLIAWAQGGRTDLDNLALLCGPHHTAVHAGVYNLVMIAGVPWVRMPALVDPARPLQRNTLHHDTARARKTGEQIRLTLDPKDLRDPWRPPGLPPRPPQHQRPPDEQEHPPQQPETTPPQPHPRT